jgi:hypothetical protein
MSHAEAAVSDIYNGRRPGLEEFAQMQQAWDQAEQKEIPYIVWVAFDQKYVANYESGQGIFIELGGVNDGDFEEPVTAALQGQTVHAVELQTRLVETDEGHWYSVDGITFRIGDIS